MTSGGPPGPPPPPPGGGPPGQPPPGWGAPEGHPPYQGQPPYQGGPQPPYQGQPPQYQGGPPPGWGPPGPDPTSQAVGRRIGAALIDFLLLVVLFIIVGIALGEDDTSGDNVGITLEGAGALLYFALVFGYYIATEATWHATLGKRATGVVVRSADGTEPSIGQIVGRNLLRFVDGFFFYLVGLITMLVTKRKQRVGDLAAGTIVVPRQ